MAEKSVGYQHEKLDLLENRDEFVARHVGPNTGDITAMLSKLNLNSLDALIEKTVPKSIRSSRGLDLPQSLTEQQLLTQARQLASQNQVFKSFIGMGYHGTHTPSVILRNILENPGWYTAYTPYQAEIAQGRLEALLNFQTMIMDLTAMPIANASLLDEGTAAAEAMAMCFHETAKKGATQFLVSDLVHPQTLEVLQTRAEPLGIELVVGGHKQFKFTDKTFAMLLQYPGSTGEVGDYKDLTATAKAAQTMTIVAADLLSLVTLTPPGEWGADVVVGSSQRFGVPMGFGGPHAAFFATKEEFKRSIPGRIVGVSVDSHGQPALRLALQTREQHIRREKATSNICTAQVLLAVMASMYAVYHGPEGLKRIASRTHRMAAITAEGLKKLGFEVLTKCFFDTLQVQLPTADIATKLRASLQMSKVNLRWYSELVVGITTDETTTRDDVAMLFRLFAMTKSSDSQPSSQMLEGMVDELDAAFVQNSTSAAGPLPQNLLRKSEILKESVFHRFHSEHELLRYMQRLQSKDLSLTHSMIPLGSCTMKLNATTEMMPVTMPEFASLHPFAPLEQAKGSVQMIRELEGMLCEITGFAGVSLQPNAGSQGEYAGLMVIRKFHQSRGQGHRNICLIPSSAHGTNPASAVMAGMKVVVTACDSQGNVDLNDLRAKAELHKENLSALMVTYPSTHGVFEEGITEICTIIHQHGGQVYMDGANFNALVGLCRPGDFGPDVCHLNLHKTFCIPHGGGGPGVGPIGVAAHLKAFLPTHSLQKSAGPTDGIKAVSSAPWGSAGILCISWAYIKLMGRDGLKRATEVAILNANYIAARLGSAYPVLYKGQNGYVAHECILDLRPLKAFGVEVEDVAKRLQDYGYHAPTMSWPVIGTLMVEPTESESKHELDRFCDAMLAIREEARAVETGAAPREGNLLKRAPHTASDVLRTEWDRPYSREQAAFPLPWVREAKFWPSVGRVNNAHGDRNLVCSCAPLESYQS